MQTCALRRAAVIDKHNSAAPTEYEAKGMLIAEQLHVDDDSLCASSSDERVLWWRIANRTSLAVRFTTQCPRWHKG